MPHTLWFRITRDIPNAELGLGDQEYGHVRTSEGMLFTTALHFLGQENETQYLCYFVLPEMLMSLKSIPTYTENVQ